MSVAEEKQIAVIVAAVEAGDLDTAFHSAESLHARELAHVVESLPRKLRLGFWHQFDTVRRGEILAEIEIDEVRHHLVQTMDGEMLAAVTESLAVDEKADILESASKEDVAEVLASLDKQHREQLERVIAYSEDTAGSLVDTDVVSVRPDVTVDVVHRYLHHIRVLPEHTTEIVVVDRENHYIGVVPIGCLFTESPGSFVRDCTVNRPAIAVDTDVSEVVQLFTKHDWVAAPVIDENGVVIGRITVDDVLDAMRDEAEQSVRGMVGLSEDEDTFAPILVSAGRRALWLGLNLLTALIAAHVIGLFERTIEEIVALAVLMPIVASMGGIAGSQTLTLVTRGLALGKVGMQNIRWLLRKEIAVGCANGVLWALVVAIVTYAWFDSAAIAVIIGIAIIVNLIVAALSGVVIPMLLHALSLDPALGGGVILTTVTDVIGFWAFLGFATFWFL